MTTLLARYENLVPYQSQHADNGIPREVMEHLAATRVYPIVSPEGLVGRNAMAPLRGWPGLCLTIAECIPGDGPVAHNHTGTLETFFCVHGQFAILWGNQLEHQIVLNPGDLCSVPPKMYRSFKNLSNQDAQLLVLIQGDANMSDKIEMPRSIGTQIASQHGSRVVDLLAGINMRFQGDDEADFTPPEMEKRIVRLANLQAAAPAATTFPLMVGDGTAPVQCWPGLGVDILVSRPGEPSSQTLDAAHCQWIVNIGQAECAVAWDDESIALKYMDMVCVPEGKLRTVHNLSDAPGRLLLATQGRVMLGH